MRRCILLSLRKVPDNTVHVLGCRHKQIYSFEIGLRIPPFGNGFNHCGLGGKYRCDGYSDGIQRTGDIFCQNVELLQDGSQQFLRVFIYDEDLPFAGRINGSYRFKKFYKASEGQTLGSRRTEGG